MFAYKSPKTFSIELSPKLVNPPDFHQLWWHFCRKFWWNALIFTNFDDVFFTILGDFFNKQLAPFVIPSFYWRWRCIVNDVNIIVNVLLGVRYFFTHRAFFPIILRVLGIRYFFTHRVLVSILHRDLQLVNYCQHIIGY